MDKRNVWIGVTAVLAGLVSACSDAPVDQLTEDGELGTATQAFATVACGRESVTPHATFEGSLPADFVSPQSYNKCTKSFIVDLFNLDAHQAQTGIIHDSGFEVGYRGPAPTNRAECEAMGAGIIVYERVDDAWVALERVDTTGFFIEGFPITGCFGPGAAFHGVEAGKSYRIAGTVRDGANVTQPMLISHAPALNPPQ